MLPLSISELVVTPVVKLEVIAILLHVFDDGPPCSVVMLLLPEFNEVENVHDCGFDEILNLVEHDDVESKVF